MTDSRSLHPIFTAIVDRDGSDECKAHAQGFSNTVSPPVQHCLTFETPDGVHLVQLDTTGSMPIPAVGETIVLHDQPVTVLTTETAYTRLGTGQVALYTQVVVDTITIAGG
ncbi:MULTISPECIES: hypothetical protein [unclassified Streptomyces]|uniref:hypothetical protein n=1 Tax=unclassified Streptomyces TaxID=2593676 RepID=UPI003390B151